MSVFCDTLIATTGSMSLLVDYRRRGHWKLSSQNFYPKVEQTNYDTTKVNLFQMFNSEIYNIIDRWNSNFLPQLKL